VADESYIPFTQLWKGEQAVLRQIAAAVPPGGTIVEIGTAEGGTALLMHRAAAQRGVRIYTVDIAPSPRAREHLRDTGVAMLAQPSAEAARCWRQIAGQPIDMLFIDGSHQLADVVSDFTLWAPHLRPGGLVVFHDYDPIERGGIVHLAVRIAVDAALATSQVRNPVHRYKLLYGTVERPSDAAITLDACRAQLGALAQRVATARAAAERGAALVADDRFAALLKGCLPAADRLEVLAPAEVREPGQTYLVCAHPVGLPLELLRARGVPPANVVVIDSVIACYLLAAALRSDVAHLVAHTTSRSELLFWAETLAMHEHATGETGFPQQLAAVAAAADLDALSRFVAREQVRLTILARILRTFVDWTP
jgi:predicted O-methyltransferase YrrM